MEVLKVDKCEEGSSTVKLERNFLELDLDYLERRQVPNSLCSPGSLSQVSPDAPELVKLVLLGAPGVGKNLHHTAIRVEQFQGGVLADQLSSYLLPHSDRQRTSVRAQDHRLACGAVHSRRLCVRACRLPSKRRHSIHASSRSLGPGDDPIPGDRP
ncbi:uncharacterized protein LOC128998580 [Macrosteles quadrilineatus]|uniref:uncharacterized protein LOC128998580 n=1 Tax=Macrosteles quadrilineatus TaxID=74068 RepID=UPI0023E31960|nr:uncharacterized protein LOC128998580 [Macrosteles quadrilineatus]